MQAASLSTIKKVNWFAHKPFLIKPAFFWGDDQGEKYHQAYFAEYDNIWHHGDYVELKTRRRGGYLWSLRRHFKTLAA